MAESSMEAGASVDWDTVFSSDTEDEAAGRAKAEKKMGIATQNKQNGNALMQAGKLSEAEVLYRKALSAIWAPYRQRKDAAAVALGVAVDLNLALCYLKLERWDAARRSASRALEVEPENPKGLYRRGLASARLDLLDAAHDDLSKAWQHSPSPDVQQELQSVRERRGSKAVPRGFLKEAKEPKEELEEEPKKDESQEGPQEALEDESDWAVTEQVEDALSEAGKLLLAISERRIACRSQTEVKALLRQLDSLSELLPQARTAIAAAITIPAPETLEPKECCELFERMAEGLWSFRPFFALQERQPGEFRNLRVCRQLGTNPKSKNAWPRSFDVELIRWGEAKAATPGDFAEALFPPSGKPPNKAAARWQSEVFFRVFQKDAGNYVAGAVWLLLREALQRGIQLQVKGRAILEVGLCQGMFFEAPEKHGPAAEREDQAPQDSLAICSGADRRLILVPTFTTVGVPHKWLLLKSEDQVMAADLCSGALGLLDSGSGLSPVRIWDSQSDPRYVVRCSAWGEDARLLARPPKVGGSSGATQMRLAVGSLLAASGLGWDARLGDELAESLMQEPSTMQLYEDDTLETARRLHNAITLLGLSASLPSSFLEAASDEDIAAVHAEAVGQMAQRKLRSLGFEKLAEGISPTFMCLFAALLPATGNAKEREHVAPNLPEYRRGQDVRTLQTKSTWRMKDGQEDKRSLLAKLRDPNSKPRDLATTVAALQQRRLLTESREYTTAINVLGKLGLWRECLGLLVDMQRNGLTPNVITYNAVLKSLARNRRWQEAIQLIGEIWESGLSPDVISYTTAISACADSGRWKEALQLLAEMERAGIKADVRIFNAAINACAQAGEAVRALLLFQGMPERGLVPDTITYNALINACARGGAWEDALQSLTKMKEQGLTPQTRTYNSAINACDKAFRGYETLLLLDDMHDHEARPNAVTYNTAMSACLKGGMQEESDLCTWVVLFVLRIAAKPGLSCDVSELLDGSTPQLREVEAGAMSSRPGVEARVDLPDDPEEARVKYIKLRQLVRETFESFLRSLNSQSLRWLEQQFEDHGEKLNSGKFLRIFSRVCPRLESATFPKYEERKLAVHLSVLKLFEGMDVDESGETSWMEFVEFISAVAEELRLKAQELSGQIFEFHTASLVLPNYKPTITKCHFDKVYFWPNHPMESAIVFEEGQASFFLHRQQTMLRRRRVDGHQSDLLAAAFLYTDREDANVNLVVTSGNDKTLCFWDANAFNLVKRWSLKDVVGELCWCGEINALYAADHFSERFWGWLIRDELEVKT
ncbi:EMB2745, partial [Symbiodinium necroappetens]